MNNSSGFNVTPSLASAACVCDYTTNSYAYMNNLVAAVVSALVAPYTAISNVVVIVTVIRTARLHAPANILLCSMACGDILVAVFPQPVLVAFLVSSNARVDCCLFETLSTIHKFSMPVAFGGMVQVCVMCWDRLKATADPLRYRAVVSKKKMTVVTVTAWVAWFVNFALSGTFLPPEITPIKGGSAAAILFIFLVVSQILTSKNMRAHNSSVAKAVPRATAMAREKRMAVTLRWIIGTYLVSSSPLIVYMVSTAAIGGESLFSALLSPWAKFALFLNSAVNPIIYFWRHQNMRSAASELVGPPFCSASV